MLSQTIMFGLVILNVTSDIMRTHAHLKPVMRTNFFYGLAIFRMHDQYDFGRFGIISAPQTLAC